MQIRYMPLLIASALTLGVPVAAHAGVDFTSEIVTVTDLGGGNYSFVQGGFSEGAQVTGTFSGSEIVANGQLSAFDGEITAFSMSFSGNSLVGAFSLGLGDLFGLVYDFDGDIGDGLALDIEGIGAGFYPVYVAGPGPLALCDGEANCGLVEGPAIPTPAPPALGLLGLGLLGLGLTRRRYA